MRITVEDDNNTAHALEQAVRQALARFGTLDVLAAGTKANLSGDQTSYVSLLVSFGAGVSGNIIASALYDIAKLGFRIFKINGRDATAMSREEVTELVSKPEGTSPPTAKDKPAI